MNGGAGEVRPTRLHQVHQLGQSIWYDNIRRDLLEDGGLAQRIAQGVSGVTSNPTIFERAITTSSAYDEAIYAFGAEGSVSQLYEELVREDIGRAADLLRPVYEITGGEDGYVSVEVSPSLAYDEEGTVAQALHLLKRMDRPNVMVKVPATAEGIRAIRRLVEMGTKVNVTLIFSLGQYQKVMEAYLEGLEARERQGLPLRDVVSVASFFVSRVDTVVDRLLEARAQAASQEESQRLRALMGRAAVANARLAYALYQRTFSAPRFVRLREKGARPQRPLWASTSTKNPAYPDLLYVQSLIGPETVNTMPEETLQAALDHLQPACTLTEGVRQARALVEELAQMGIDLEEVGHRLLGEGVEAFARSFRQLMRALWDKREKKLGPLVPRVTEHLGDLGPHVEAALEDLTRQNVSARLWRKDPALWGEDAATRRLVPQAMGWLEAPWAEEERLPRYQELARQVREEGWTHAVLLGMGGSSLCPWLFSQALSGSPQGLSLEVLDSTHPDRVREVAEGIPVARTLFVVSSKSGTTTEPLAMEAFFWDLARRELGEQAGRHFVAITDPGTPLEAMARSKGYRDVILGRPDVGGRYSALTAFGLVPACLLGGPAGELLRRARILAGACDPELEAAANVGVRLGAILGVAARHGRDKVTLVAEGKVARLADWLEQLLAESSGKAGTGLVPVVGEPLGDGDRYGPDRLAVWVGVGEPSEPVARRLSALEAAGHPVVRISLRDEADLGAEFFRWEVGVAVACSLLGVNAFDQPNVQESKDHTRRVLAAVTATGRWPQPPGVRLERDGLEAWVPSGPGEGDLVAALEAFWRKAQPGDYLALLAYAHPRREVEVTLQHLRRRVRDELGLATTLGWGPRFLHSTGQLHKGGVPRGLFLQVVERPQGEDVPVPGQGYGFTTLLWAQALGDAQALASRARPLLYVALPPGEEAWAQFLALVEESLRRVRA